MLDDYCDQTVVNPSSVVSHPAGSVGTVVKHGGTHTLERALAVLRAFGGHAGPLANAELVRRTGFSKASISRITGTLVKLGYLNRASDGMRFQIGMRGPMLGLTYRAGNPIKALAKPIMQKFADKHDMSVALAIGDGVDALYIEYCKSPRIATLRLGIGTRMPLELSSIGRAYLWAQTSSVRAQLMARIRQGPGENEAALERTEQAFSNLHRYGYCVAIGEFQRDAFGVSVPVHLGNPPMPFALNFGAILPAPSDAHIRNVMVPDLLKTAETLRQVMQNVSSDLF